MFELPFKAKTRLALSSLFGRSRLLCNFIGRNQPLKISCALVLAVPLLTQAVLLRRTLRRVAIVTLMDIC